ncbi:MAG: hypothetical protein E7189_01955 [Erysipelotrichaceae bacterium]|nr:hypothetical protein [Erysipelotrichaceae bacterium]
MAKVVLFCLIVFIIVNVINQYYCYLNPNSNDETKRFNDMPAKIEICNFGSSHGLYAFNYEDVDDEYECFNFAFNSQRPSYDYRLLENYKDSISEGAIVFIPVSYFVFFGVSEEKDENFMARNKRYYYILPFYRIKGFDFHTWLEVKYPSLFEKEKLFETLSGNSKTMDELDSVDEVWYRISSDIDVEEDAQKAYKRHLVDGKIDENGDRIINEDEIDAVVKLIRLCKDINARPILIIPPYLREYIEEIENKESGFFEEFDEILEDIINQTDVECYDYSRDERFLDSYDLFMNADHLNIYGAREFTGILMDEVVGNTVFENV